MKADLRISVKDYSRNKNLKIQLTRVPFAAARQFRVRMNGEPWPRNGHPVSLTRLMSEFDPGFSDPPTLADLQNIQMVINDLIGQLENA